MSTMAKGWGKNGLYFSFLFSFSQFYSIRNDFIIITSLHAITSTNISKIEMKCLKCIVAFSFPALFIHSDRLFFFFCWPRISKKNKNIRRSHQQFKMISTKDAKNEKSPKKVFVRIQYLFKWDCVLCVYIQCVGVHSRWIELVSLVWNRIGIRNN